MTSSYDEDALRHWLADYLVTNVGCSLYDIDALGDSDSHVLDDLFDSVESAPAGSERGI